MTDTTPTKGRGIAVKVLAGLLGLVILVPVVMHLTGAFVVIRWHGHRFRFGDAPMERPPQYRFESATVKKLADGSLEWSVPVTSTAGDYPFTTFTVSNVEGSYVRPWPKVGERMPDPWVGSAHKPGRLASPPVGSPVPATFTLVFVTEPLEWEPDLAHSRLSFGFELANPTEHASAGGGQTVSVAK